MRGHNLYVGRQSTRAYLGRLEHNTLLQAAAFGAKLGDHGAAGGGAANVRLERSSHVVDADAGRDGDSHLGDDADDQEIRALVAETAGASFEARDARRHVDAHAKHRAKVVDEIASLERRQDELLDRM